MTLAANPLASLRPSGVLPALRRLLERRARRRTDVPAPTEALCHDMRSPLASL